ncbi:LysR family hydrogen peroxide-inducible transcriptional activator [Streptosporangium becharense]|uniref:Probable hydrogen peroxide-inducible genes activator n=1 Tax=Streptosporangium becharense TaxID=1816182 RepID=A0A7W9MJF6_9ACTN|nr:LysR substrate-binding domain-containing protein [Streptosporangium becharense]MBB2911703.1 LysR family hydrogen peroxide-inducible transcriptional activator [Streptosporangium becharense]MBB5822479.1 LysR family hydrogen peroxide-inducible transcriptional activator [Streptosporangium becharense]
MFPISDPAPTLAQLRAFLAVAEHLHFREAAHSLRMSQSALSSAVSALEETLHTRLLERTTRKVLLTPTGEQVAVHAARVLKAVDDLMGEAAHSREPFSTPVHLGVIPTVAPYVLPVLLPMFGQAFPLLKLTVHEAKTETIVEELREGRLDMVLLALPTETTGLVEVPLYHEDFLLAVPQDHALARQSGPLARDVLKDLDIVLLNQGHCLREQAMDICREVGARATAATYATSLPTLVHLVAGGLGVTLIPESAVPVETGKHARLALRRFRAPAPGRTIGLAYRASSGRAAEYRRLAEAVHAAVAGRGLPVRMAARPGTDGDGTSPPPGSPVTAPAR